MRELTDEDMDKKILELSKIPGVGVRFSKRLYDAGYKTPEDLKYATEEDLLKISGMTRERAKTILSSVKETILEEKEEEEIEKTISDMQKEISEIEESVSRGEEIKFKVVKARAELAPVILPDEEEIKKEEEEKIPETPPAPASKKKPTIISTAGTSPEAGEKEKPTKKRPVIRGEIKKPATIKHAKAIAVCLLAVILISTVIFVYFASQNREPIIVDGNFSDWSDKIRYKETQACAVPDIQITSESVLYASNTLYFFVEVNGFMFNGANDGVDALMIFVDADADAQTGYCIASGGADYRIELIGWNLEVVKAIYYRYNGSNEQNDWNAWVNCGQVKFVVNKNVIEGRVVIEASNPRCLFYMKHTDANTDVVFQTTYVYPQSPMLHVCAKLTENRIITKGVENPIVTLEFTAKGGYISLRNISLLNFSYGTISCKFLSGSTSYFPWILSENLPQTIQVLLTPDDGISTGNSIDVNGVSVDADCPVLINHISGKFYIETAPGGINIDGVFDDWKNITDIVDSTDENIPDSINIVRAKTAMSESAFYIETKSAMLAGVEVPLGKLVRKTENAGANATAGNLYGFDYIRVYIDTAPSQNSKNSSAGIVNGYLIEIAGMSGRIYEKNIYRIENGDKNRIDNEINAANNASAIELMASLVLPSDAVCYFETWSVYDVGDVLIPVVPITRYYHNQNQGSFGSFWQIGSTDATISTFVTGDFNNDGWDDILAVTASASPDVILFLNNNGAGFTNARQWDFSSTDVYACAVGDFDRNGWLDAIIGTKANSGSSSDKTELRALNNTNFNFAIHDIANLDTDINSISVADINMDGYPDFVCGCGTYSGYEVLAFINSRSGFSFTQNNLANPNKLVYCVTADTLNSHPMPEVAYGTEGNSSKELVVLQNSGSWQEKFYTGDGNKVYDVCIRDLNNDGTNDIVYCTGNKKLYVAIAIGSFSYDVSTIATFSSEPTTMAICDFDNDGYQDIIVGCNDGTLYGFENKRNCTFNFTNLTPLSVGIKHIQTCDYDHDGDMDILLCASTKMYILNNTLLHRNCEINTAGKQLPYGLPVCAVSLADLDLDGDLDVVAGYSDGASGYVYAWENPGDGHSTPWETGLSWNGHQISNFARIDSLTTGDINNDGYPEIIFAGNSNGNKLCVATSEGSPWHDNWLWDYEENYSGTIRVGPISQIALGDLNWDGLKDVVTGDAGGRLVIWKRGTDAINDSNGDWLDDTVIHSTSSAIHTLAIGDMDHDGWLDVVAGYESSSEAGIIWQSRKNPFSQTSGWYQHDFDTVDANITKLALGDLNNDGYTDIAGVVNGTSALKIWLYNGSIDNWTSCTLPAQSPGISAIALGDMNNDGLTDIVLGKPDGNVSIIINSGSTVLPQSVRTYQLGNHESISAIAIGNIDRRSYYDGGDNDLVVGAGISAYAYKNTGANVLFTTYQTPGTSIPPGTTCAIMRVEATHNGKITDNSAVFSALSVRFDNAVDSRIMTDAEMQAIFENVSIWYDANANSIFENSSDVWITSVNNSMFQLNAGYLKINLPSNNYTKINGTESKSYFITVKTKANISGTYNNYKFSIYIIPETQDIGSAISWNTFQDSVTYGIATIMEGTGVSSNQFTIVTEGTYIYFLCIPLFVCLHAVYYRKLRRRTF